MNDNINLAQTVKRIEEVFKTRDDEREKRSTDRHARIQEFQGKCLKMFEKLEIRVSANEKGRYVLWGIYLGSATVLATIWTIFKFFLP